MVCTNDADLYETVRMLRSHGMVRELRSDEPASATTADDHPDLNPDFIFAFPAYNVRSTEINAVIGRSQLKRLDDNNRRRTENLQLFLRQPRSGHVSHRFRDRGQQQLRLHAGPQRARRSAAATASWRRCGRTASSSAAARRAAATSCASRTCASCSGRRLEAVSRGPTTSISTASTSATIRLWNSDKILRLCELLNDLAAPLAKHGQARPEASCERER